MTKTGTGTTKRAMEETFASTLRVRALEAGFSVVRFTEASLPPEHGRNLEAYIAGNAHGTMTWMAETRERRIHPRALWPEARSAVMLGLNYAPPIKPVTDPADPRGQISAYARNLDYHDVLKKRLKQLARWMAEQIGEPVKVFVDTAPLMESPLAAQSGMGWIGRHTNLVSRTFGSWLFLGEILTAFSLPSDPPGDNHCGTCCRCRNICPTGALTHAGEKREGHIDARRCVSYLTIEHKGVIPPSLRPLIGLRIYGCDECVSVCPWNVFAPPTRDPAFLPRMELIAPRLRDLLHLDDTAFRRIFTGSPVKRIGRDRFLRNTLIATGNAGDTSLLPTIYPLLDDASPLVRGMAVWACRRLLSDEAFFLLRTEKLPKEQEEVVRQEWIA